MADLLFHGLQNLFILCFSLRPVLGLVLVGVEGIDLAERVKGRVYIQAFLLLWREKTKEFVVLGPQFEDLIYSYYHVIEVGVRESLSFPLMLNRLTFPEFSGQLCNSILPALKDSHAFIQLDSDIRERGYPDVILLEFNFYPSS